MHACAPPPPAHAILSCAALGHSSAIKLCALWRVALACRAAVERSHVLAEVASVEPLSAPREARGECAGPSHTHTHIHCTHAPQSSPHAHVHPPRLCITGTVGVKRGLAQMLKGGVIMDVSDHPVALAHVLSSVGTLTLHPFLIVRRPFCQQCSLRAHAQLVLQPTPHCP